MFALSKVFCFVALVAVFSTFALGLPSVAPPSMPSQPPHPSHPPHPSLPTGVPPTGVPVGEEVQQVIEEIVAALQGASIPTGRPAPALLLHLRKTIKKENEKYSKFGRISLAKFVRK